MSVYKVVVVQIWPHDPLIPFLGNPTHTPTNYTYIIWYPNFIEMNMLDFILSFIRLAKVMNLLTG